jgi:sulfur relay (sulfurtransferase) complex TusBCD TusD component (DsrE family)
MSTKDERVPIGLKQNRWIATQCNPKCSTPKTFGLHVLGAPESSAGLTALEFGETALNLGHSVALIFFNGPSVQIARKSHNPTNKGGNARQTAWESLAQRAKIALSVCSGSAEKYHVHELSAPWTLASLSDLLDGYQNQHHVITFNSPPS